MFSLVHITESSSAPRGAVTADVSHAVDGPAIALDLDVMRNAWSIVGKVICVLIAIVAPALAQNQLARGVAPAATVPAYDVSVGYSNLTMAMPSAKNVNLSGVDVGGRANLNSHWGVMLDSMYVRTSSVFGTGHGAYQWSFLGGPVFYPLEHKNYRVFLHAMGGVALVDGAVPINTTDYFYGWVVRPSYALGGGVERSLSGPFGVRVRADYLHSAFFDARGAVQPQGNLRLTASLVFRLNARQPAWK